MINGFPQCVNLELQYKMYGEGLQVDIKKKILGL